jgi:hypothetical protein
MRNANDNMIPLGVDDLEAVTGGFDEAGFIDAFGDAGGGGGGDWDFRGLDFGPLDETTGPDTGSWRDDLGIGGDDWGALEEGGFGDSGELGGFDGLDL